MGLRVRKSFNSKSGFRVNLSKSGIGYSQGVKGLRLTKTSTGRNRVTATIPNTGISYIKESSNPSSNNEDVSDLPLIINRILLFSTILSSIYVIFILFEIISIPSSFTFFKLIYLFIIAFTTVVSYVAATTCVNFAIFFTIILYLFSIPFYPDNFYMPFIFIALCLGGYLSINKQKCTIESSETSQTENKVSDSDDSQDNKITGKYLNDEIYRAETFKIRGTQYCIKNPEDYIGTLFDKDYEFDECTKKYMIANDIDKIYEYELVDNYRTSFEFEEDNPEDSNAVAVYINNIKIGYIAKGSCSHFKNIYDKIEVIDVEFYGGPRKQLFEVDYDLEKDKTIYDYEKETLPLHFKLIVRYKR